jgi:hypothetical protein
VGAFVILDVVQHRGHQDADWLVQIDKCAQGRIAQYPVWAAQVAVDSDSRLVIGE